MIRLLLCTTLLAIGGCGSQGLRTTDGQYGITWTPQPPQVVPTNEYFDIVVQVEPAHGSLRGHDMVFDATMPAHRHGMNVIVTPEQTGPDAWIVRDVLLHMPGEWVFDFDVIDDRGVLHRAREAVVLK
ncbi:MAG: hypothetical protein QF733_02145 [Phycisphaerales bacterium]|jgi:hypothetical protein|nr:hypothetical protein [Phycisphaerales bacterium]